MTGARRRGLSRVLARRLVLMSGACTMVFGAAAAPPAHAELAAAAASGARPATSERCFGAVARDPRLPCRNPALRKVVEPTPFDAVLEPSEPCIPLRGVGVEACSFGAPRSKARGTIALIGDSHATHWRGALAVIAAERELRGISITRSGCPLTLARSKGAGRCGNWSRRVLDWIDDRPEITAVVVSSSTGARVVPERGLSDRETKIRGYGAAWAELPSTVRDLYVIRDVPHMSFATLGCVEDAAAAGDDAADLCARPRRESLKTDHAAIAARRSPDRRHHLIDLTSFMCDRAVCFPVVGGALVSKDAGHLTRTFSRTMGPYLERAMASVTLPRPEATPPPGFTPFPGIAPGSPPASPAPAPAAPAVS